MPEKVPPARREFLKWVGLGGGAAVLGLPESAAAQTAGSGTQGPVHVRAFGATGDGKTLDTASVNRAIEAAVAQGGGTVWFSAGQYLCHSIHLRSHVCLYLDAGAVLIAADALPPGVEGGYDEPEPKQPWEAYQDYGHNHWHNSLLWGEGLDGVSIMGPGRIWGRGLLREYSPSSNHPEERRTQGTANKAIALKNCRNVILRDFQVLAGGWFALLATGVDNLTIDNVTVDTNRDGFDIDCCRNVRVSNCAVNSPWDDAIVPKSSFALGYARSTENVTITNCYVTGAYRMGTFLDGTFVKFAETDMFAAYGRVTRVPRTGRIKLGTESNGGFKNITISNCVFEGCQGLALESEDGALLEDITITNITMRDVVSTPIFLRLGARKRGPAPATQAGALRRVLISHIVSSNSEAALGAGIISGVPGFAVEDLRISNVYIQHKGGGTATMAAMTPPEREAAYPDPDMFGAMPSSGFYVRHVQRVEFDHVEVAVQAADARPCFVLKDVAQAEFMNIKAPAGQPVFRLLQTSEFSSFRTRGVTDVTLANVTEQTL
jgi:polygalacturonase